MHQIMTTDRDQQVRPAKVGGLRAAAAGLGAAWRAGRLVAILWIGFVALGLLAALPSWRGYATALAHAPEGDRLIAGLSLPLLMELTWSEAPGSPVVFPWMLVAAMAAALVANPFLTGGAIAVLSGRPDSADQPTADRTAADRLAASRSVRERFFAGGARHYWPLARLLLLVGVAGLILLGLAGAALFGAMISAGERGAETASLALFFLTIGVLGLLAGGISLLLDFARIAMVRDGLRAWGAIKAGLRMLFRRFFGLLVFGLAFALLFGLVWALFLAGSQAIAFAGWGTIVLGIALQQLFALARTALRVAMIGGALRLMPPPVPVIPSAAAPVPAPAAASEPFADTSAPESAPEPEPEIAGLS